MTKKNTIQSLLEKPLTAYKKEREVAVNKKLLLRLAKDIGFESVMFPVEFKFNSRESMRYYLWMFELHKWLFDVKLDDISEHSHINHFKYNIAPNMIEYQLTITLKILLKEV